jgi:hypothetical protein
MLRMLQCTRHSTYGMWLTLMRQNPVVTASETPSQIVQLPARSGWPSFVDYPPRRSA